MQYKEAILEDPDKNWGGFQGSEATKAMVPWGCGWKGMACREGQGSVPSFIESPFCENAKFLEWLELLSSQTAKLHALSSPRRCTLVKPDAPGTAYAATEGTFVEMPMVEFNSRPICACPAPCMLGSLEPCESWSPCLLLALLLTIPLIALRRAPLARLLLAGENAPQERFIFYNQQSASWIVTAMQYKKDILEVPDKNWGGFLSSERTEAMVPWECGWKDIACRAPVATILNFESAQRTLRVTVLPNHNLLAMPADASHCYTVLLNSIAPEWECTPAHSGINKAIAKACVAESSDPAALSGALQQAKARFVDANGAEPTYGDVLVTATFGPLRDDGFTAIIHALGADCSDRPKRYPVPLFEPAAPATLAAVFAAYFRVLAHAGALGCAAWTLAAVAPDSPLSCCPASRCDANDDAAVGLVQLSAGVFSADQPKCAEMFALAVRAWVEVRSLSQRPPGILCPNTLMHCSRRWPRPKIRCLCGRSP